MLLGSSIAQYNLLRQITRTESRVAWVMKVTVKARLYPKSHVCQPFPNDVCWFSVKNIAKKNGKNYGTEKYSGKSCCRGLGWNWSERPFQVENQGSIDMNSSWRMHYLAHLFVNILLFICVINLARQLLFFSAFGARAVASVRRFWSEPSLIGQ